MKLKLKICLFLLIALFSCNTDNEVKNEGESLLKKIYADSTNILIPFKEQEHLNIQTFEVNTRETQIIKGKQGTVIIIPKKCFGEEYKKIKIELIECYSIQDMIYNQVSTQTTDGVPLETDGMIYINALNETGDKIEIQQGKLEIHMPTKLRKKDIQIFEGENSYSCIVWKLSNEKIINKKGLNFEPEKNFNKDTVFVQEIFYNDVQDSINQTQLSIGHSKVVIDKKIKTENLIEYVFQISKIGWINCDRYLKGDFRNLIVNLGEGQDNVSIYIVLDKYNTNLIPINKKSINGKIEFRNVPVSESFTLLALAKKGDEIYFGMANYSKHEGEVSCPELKPVTRQELTDILIEKFGKNIWNRPLS